MESLSDKQLKLLKRLHLVCNRIEEADKRTLNSLENRGLIKLSYYNFEYRASLTKEALKYVNDYKEMIN